MCLAFIKCNRAGSFCCGAGIALFVANVSSYTEINLRSTIFAS